MTFKCSIIKRKNLDTLAQQKSQFIIRWTQRNSVRLLYIHSLLSLSILNNTVKTPQNTTITINYFESVGKIAQFVKARNHNIIITTTISSLVFLHIFLPYFITYLYNIDFAIAIQCNQETIPKPQLS